MVKLILLDGVVELNEEQKEKLLKNSYFEALFLRWSGEEQGEYTVELMVNTVKFLLKEITQLDVLTQASAQAVEEARGELDLVCAEMEPFDVASDVYPLFLYPILQPYRLQKVESAPPASISIEMYPLITHWKIKVAFPDLNNLVSDPNFPQHLQIAWKLDPRPFFTYPFSLDVQQQIVQHPEIFQDIHPEDQDAIVKSIFYLKNKILVPFFHHLHRPLFDQWITRELNYDPSHSMLLKIVQFDPSKLYLCLRNSANGSSPWSVFSEFLKLFDGTDTCPLTNEEIRSFKGKGGEDYIKVWMDKQIFKNDEPVTYQTKFTSGCYGNFLFCRRLISVFPSYPFQISVSWKYLDEIIPLYIANSHLELKFLPMLDSNLRLPTHQLAFVLEHHPTLIFGVYNYPFSDSEIELLLKARVYCSSNNAFLGSPVLAERMFRATIEAQITPHSAYLDYFVQKKMWHLFSLIEPFYQTFPDRHFLLQTIMKSGCSSIIRQFLTWELSLN